MKDLEIIVKDMDVSVSNFFNMANYGQQCHYANKQRRGGGGH